MNVHPYLFFDGRCEEAIAFYRKAVGAEVVMLMRYKEAPASAGVPQADGDKVMHATLRIGDSRVSVSDGQSAGPGFGGFALSITAQDVAEVERLFGGLADGGAVQMPLTKTFFSERFGMVTDRFGVLWMVYVGLA